MHGASVGRDTFLKPWRGERDCLTVGRRLEPTDTVRTPLVAQQRNRHERRTP